MARRAQAPDTLPRAKLWAYLEIEFGLDESNALAEVGAAAAAGALSHAEEVLARRLVTDATKYERTDPLLMEIAKALSVADTQEEIDTHFRAAGKL